jgi:hypothetical protein
MGRMSDLQVQIQEMVMDGFTIEHIATTLEVPKSWVIEASAMLDDENDGQPDEAQEWHDFDPDC